MSLIHHKLWLKGEWQLGPDSAKIHSPYDQSIVAKVALASMEQLDASLQAIAACDHQFRRSSRFARSLLLQQMALGLQKRRSDLVQSLISEAGKPRQLADVEVTRAIQTFTLAAEECKRLGGEIIPVDLDAAGRAFEPMQCRFVARGPVLAITPFNFPLNLVAHKVAPAFAVGAAVLLKPPPQAPGAATILAEVFADAVQSHDAINKEIPLAAFQVIHCSNEVISRAVDDPRITILSFTGSDKVGWFLQSKAIGKKIALELGGNAAVIIDEDADIARAATRCAFGGFAYAGQICISVQRILIHEAVYDKFIQAFISEVRKIAVGNPADATTIVGPVINQDAKTRIMGWIEEAKRDGAKVLVGGASDGNIIQPTVLTDVKSTHKVSCEEVFGPVVTVQAFKTFSDALALCNASKFGLQAGVFTDSSRNIQRAFEELEVGGIIINEIPTFRADNMPYGGVKGSGLGREGVRYTMEEYCERKALVQWRGA